MHKPTYGPFHVSASILVPGALSSNWWPSQHAPAQRMQDGAICAAVSCVNMCYGYELPGVEDLKVKDIVARSSFIDVVPDDANKRFGLMLGPTMNAIAIENGGPSWCTLEFAQLPAWVLNRGPAVVFLKWHFYTKAWVGFGKYVARNIPPIAGESYHAVTLMGYRTDMKTSFWDRPNKCAFLVMDPMHPDQKFWITAGDIYSTLIDAASFIV